MRNVFLHVSAGQDTFKSKFNENFNYILNIILFFFLKYDKNSNINDTDPKEKNMH